MGRKQAKTYQKGENRGQTESKKLQNSGRKQPPPAKMADRQFWLALPQQELEIASSPAIWAHVDAGQQLVHQRPVAGRQEICGPQEAQET